MPRQSPPGRLNGGGQPDSIERLMAFVLGLLVGFTSCGLIVLAAGIG